MSYTIEAKLQQHFGRPHYSGSGWQPMSLRDRLAEALGPTLKTIAAVDSTAVLEYGLGMPGDPASHEEAIQMLANAALQAGYTVIEAYIVEHVNYAAQTAVLMAASGFGLGSRVRPEVGLVAGIVGGVAGAIAGREIKTSTPILRIVWNPYLGWRLTDLRSQQDSAARA